MQVEADFGAVAFQASCNVFDTLFVAFQIFVERSRLAVRLDANPAATGVEGLGQIHDRLKALAGFDKFFVRATKVDRQIKCADVHVGTLEELTSKLFAERVVAADEVDHVDFYAFEAVGERQFNQFILTTGNSESFKIQDLVHVEVISLFIWRHSGLKRWRLFARDKRRIITKEPVFHQWKLGLESKKTKEPHS